MTNYERIKNMSLEEMADVLDDGDIITKPCKFEYCKAKNENGECTGSGRDCREATVCWLESEAEETE